MRYPLLLVFLAVLYSLPSRVLAQAPLVANVADPKVSFNGHTYQVFRPGPDDNNIASYYDAVTRAAITDPSYCNDGSAPHMVTVTSQEENDFLYDFMNSGDSIIQAFPIPWLGWEKGAATWVSGEPVPYLNFAANEPNGGSSEPCVIFIGDQNNIAARSRWADVDCGTASWSTRGRRTYVVVEWDCEGPDSVPYGPVPTTLFPLAANPADPRVSFNGHTYQVFRPGPSDNGISSFYDAVRRAAITEPDYCGNGGSPPHMVTVTSQEENDFLYAFMRSGDPIFLNYPLAWLGWEKLTTTWVDGELVSFTNWAAGQPNGGIFEPCVALVFNQDSNFGSRWGDLNCGKSFGPNVYLVVEWDCEGLNSIPYVFPSNSPSAAPSASPSKSAVPSISPSKTPTDTPSGSPTASPSESPSASPSDSPSASPSRSPTATPSYVPSDSPTSSPSDTPSGSPTASPSESPSASPSDSPSASPSRSPTATPSYVPSDSPTSSPSDTPSSSPSATPSASPSSSPSASPSSTPSASPSGSPSVSPSKSPTSSPSASPSTSTSPSTSPSSSPSTSPSGVPSATPSLSPSSSPSETPLEICPNGRAARVIKVTSKEDNYSLDELKVFAENLFQTYEKAGLGWEESQTALVNESWICRYCPLED